MEDTTHEHVVKKQKIETDHKQIIISPEKDLILDRVISDEDMKFFELNGYIIIKNAVPDEMCDAVVDSMFKFCKMTPNNPQDWYRPPIAPNGFVEMYHQQSMWNTRQHPRIYRAFAELWNSGKLWVSIDRVCMKLPQNPINIKYNHKGFVHWDLDPWEQNLPFGLQGVLTLADTTEHQGGFHCVPGMHKFLAQWIKKVPEWQRDTFHEKRIPIAVPPENLKKLKLLKVLAKKGDLIIWRRELAHGNGFNTSSKPRLAQYINMFPARDNDMAILGPQLALHPDRRFERIKMAEGKLAPGYRRPNIMYDESVDKTPIELTDLGKKLLGSELWK